MKRRLAAEHRNDVYRVLPSFTEFPGSTARGTKEKTRPRQPPTTQMTKRDDGQTKATRSMARPLQSRRRSTSRVDWRIDRSRDARERNQRDDRIGRNKKKKKRKKKKKKKRQRNGRNRVARGKNQQQRQRTKVCGRVFAISCVLNEPLLGTTRFTGSYRVESGLIGFLTSSTGFHWVFRAFYPI